MEAQRTRIVGILEPFEHGADVGRLVEEGARLHAAGADIIDIDATAEGWRDGADRAALAALVAGIAAGDASVSVTTTSADIAVVAADHGAEYVIDPSGGAADPFMPRIVAAGGLGYVVGQWAFRHAAGHHLDIETFSSRDDFVAAVQRRIETLLEGGVDPDRLILDSGAGLFLHGDEEWRMLDHLDQLAFLGHPLLVNASRPLLLASLLPDDASEEQRDAAALAVSALAVETGAWAVRVRNVARTARALQGMLRYASETH